ncbi:SDR family NAD(P)-dependent oxidoreductase [Arcicella rigui]|uniref:SDR family oxidoreductase n=1 Tax=Arcicella rigui TaxID=797020 RepID=A0ABU5Q7A2_9BACT|nr:SDR family oxidoreductase [Arcicella rigui]MEA5138512.1 SDR family oxidoreductase [Arcicella rigui]
MTNNKTVLVTGGAGGIGSAICRKFAEAGYAVIITYNGNLEKAEKLCNSLVGEGHSVFHAPVNDAKRLSELADFVENKYGKLDVLVNNAGITTPVAHNDLDGLTDEWIDRIFETNVRGTFAMIRACKALLLKSKDALVVNISSVAAISGVGSNVAYCASKAAIDSITRSLARALAPNIRVVSVSPGWVLGEYTKNIDPQYLQTQIDKTPLGRLAIAEDVANTVFVLTTHLTFTTGSIIPVDGGRLL